MSIGISLLLHRDFDRAAELTRALLRYNCKIAVHVDASAPEHDADAYLTEFCGHPNVIQTERIKCEWGSFSLVKAQLIAAQALMGFKNITHVVQLSGSCLPTRPLPELIAFLKKNRGTDFIESVLAGQNNWIKGGLEAERTSLYFPFSWKRQRRRFDASVWIQRKLRINRKLPKGLEAHVGSQWWALSRETLLAILNDPMRTAYDRFYAKCWIPDESYFQTLARKHAKRIESRSLTFSRFDPQGNPMLFYNNHLEYLEHLHGFFVRKVWNGSDRLYNELLSPNFTAGPRDPEMRAVFTAQTERMEGRRKKGRVGLHMQSKALGREKGKAVTAAPYSVFVGFSKVYKEFDIWLGQQTQLSLLCDVFESKARDLAKNPYFSKGNLSAKGHIRDHAPIQYLTNLIWNNRDIKLGLQFWSPKKVKVFRFVTRDINATIFYIRGAWILDLMHENITNMQVLRMRFSKKMDMDEARIEAMQAGKARFHVVSIADALMQPGKTLHELVAELAPEQATKPRILPRQHDWEGLEKFVLMLNNNGMNIDIDLTQLKNASRQKDQDPPFLIAE